MVHDSISDALARLRNAQMVRKSFVEMPFCKHVADLLRVLLAEGYLASLEKKQKQGFPVLNVTLKYIHGNPVISEMKRVSRPGRRFYVSVKDIPKVRGGLGISVLSTSSGLLTDVQARSRNVGGELLCQIF